MWIKKLLKCFSMKLNIYWESFCCYFLVVSTTLKKVFSLFNFSDNYVPVPSSCIPTCTYCIYYCSLPSSSASPSSLLNLPILCLDTLSIKTCLNGKVPSKSLVMCVCVCVCQFVSIYISKSVMLMNQHFLGKSRT